MTLQKQCWAFQDEAVQYLADHPNAVIDLKMGAGKSRIAIQHIRRFGTQGSRKTLIVCPAAVLPVWRGEFQKHAPGEFNVVVLDGTGGSAVKAQRISEGLMRLEAGGLPLVVVVNFETMWRTAVYEILMKCVWEIMCLDELHKIKSASVSAKASKSCWHLGKKAKRRIGLTGTLAPHSPMDFFAAYRFLDETIFGRYITHYRNQYAVMNQYIPARVDKWVRQDELQRKVNLIRFHIDREILVLPDKQDIVIECPMSPKGMKVYQEMKKESIAVIRQHMENSSPHPDLEHGQQFSDGDDVKERLRTVVAGNGAVQFLRLLQLAQGYAKDDEGVEVDTDTEKRKMLLELLEQTDEPVCVFGWFHHDMKIVEDCCKLLGRRYGEISGTRKDLTEHGKFPENVDVLGVQCKSGSSGIDLTRSRIAIVLNSGTMSPGDFDQMIARQHRPGQTRNVVYYHLVTPKTVDVTIQKARQERRDVIDAILNGLLEEEVF